MEFRLFIIKSVFFDKIGIIKTSNEEEIKAKDKTSMFLNLSASFPPIQLPRDRPRSVTPMTDVQVKTELPIEGATILAEINSTVIIENPAINEAII